MAWILGGERLHVKEYERSESEIWEGMPTKPVVTHTSISEGHLSLGTWLHPEPIMGSEHIQNERFGVAMSACDIWVWSIPVEVEYPSHLHQRVPGRYEQGTTGPHLGRLQSTGSADLRSPCSKGCPASSGEKSEYRSVPRSPVGPGPRAGAWQTRDLLPRCRFPLLRGTFLPFILKIMDGPSLHLFLA